MRIGIDARFALRQRRGIGNYVAKLVHHLSQIDRENEYILYVDSDKQKELLPSRDNFTVKRLVPANYPMWEQLVLPVQAAKDRLDILHSTGNTAPVSLERRIKRICTIHDVMYLAKGPSTARAGSWYQACGRVYQKMVVRRAAGRLCAVITVSEFSKQQIARQVPGLSPEQITVIHEAGNDCCRLLDRRCAGAELDKRYGIADGYILALGGTDPRKNTKLVIDAYTQLRSHGLTDRKLVIAGLARWTRSRFYRAVARSPYRDDVISTGFVTEQELVLLYNCAAVFLYPSLYEGFGLPPLEAMACGTPVIASGTTSIPEVAGDAAILIDPADARQLSNAVRRLLNDRDLRAALIERGLEQARKFSWTATAEKTLGVYESVYRGWN